MSYWTFKNWYFNMIMNMYKPIIYSMYRCNKYSGMKYCNHNDWCNVWTFYNKHQPLKGLVSLSYRLCVMFKWIPNQAFVILVDMKFWNINYNPKYNFYSLCIIGAYFCHFPISSHYDVVIIIPCLKCSFFVCVVLLRPCHESLLTITQGSHIYIVHTCNERKDGSAIDSSKSSFPISICYRM